MKPFANDKISGYPNQSESGARVLECERTQYWKIQDKVPDCACSNDKDTPVNAHSCLNRPLPETQYWLDVRTIAHVQ